jgi:hypothetical protein
MSRRAPRPASLTIVVVVAIVLAALVSSQVALAVFNKTAAGGLTTIATSTLAPATLLTVSQVNCRNKKTPEIEVDWAATSSSYVTSYSVERATSSNGTYTLVATVLAEQTVYTDKSGSLGYSTTYYYRVSALYRSWSAVSTVKSVKTLSNSCV